LVRAELDERESPRPPGLAVDGEVHIDDVTDFREKTRQLLSGGGEIQVAYENLLGNDPLLLWRMPLRRVAVLASIGKRCRANWQDPGKVAGTRLQTPDFRLQGKEILYLPVP
jgi:hypothetical protein